MCQAATAARIGSNGNRIGISVEGGGGLGMTEMWGTFGAIWSRELGEMCDR